MLALCVRERLPTGWALHGAGRLENALPVHRWFEAPTRSAQSDRVHRLVPTRRTDIAMHPSTHP